jgi:hypothetical protein
VPLYSFSITFDVEIMPSILSEGRMGVVTLFLKAEMLFGQVCWQCFGGLKVVFRGGVFFRIRTSGMR